MCGDVHTLLSLCRVCSNGLPLLSPCQVHYDGRTCLRVRQYTLSPESEVYSSVGMTMLGAEMQECWKMLGS